MTTALVGGLVCQSTVFGSACDRSSGVPPVSSLDPSFQPGGDVTARAVALPPAAPLALLLGFSRRDFGGATLPLARTPLGRPGCSLLTSSDVALTFPTTGVPLPTSLLPMAGETFLQTISWTPSTGALSGVSHKLALRVPTPRSDFTIVMLADTQVGDVVQNNARNPIEFSRADAAMARLDSRVPYSVALGNHDFDVVNDKTAVDRLERTIDMEPARGRACRRRSTARPTRAGCWWPTAAMAGACAVVSATRSSNGRC
jgi:hypothetical protein